jgi:hypothetical protein
MLIEKGESVMRAGLREIFFGEMLQNVPHVARFVEAFTVTHQLSGAVPCALFRYAFPSHSLSLSLAGTRPIVRTLPKNLLRHLGELHQLFNSTPHAMSELWLVFHDEGLSLNQVVAAAAAAAAVCSLACGGIHRDVCSGSTRKRC